jgi:hypothetical protein
MRKPILAALAVLTSIALPVSSLADGKGPNVHRAEIGAGARGADDTVKTANINVLSSGELGMLKLDTRFLLLDGGKTPFYLKGRAIIRGDESLPIPLGVDFKAETDRAGGGINYGTATEGEDYFSALGWRLGLASYKRLVEEDRGDGKLYLEGGGFLFNEEKLLPWLAVGYELEGNGLLGEGLGAAGEVTAHARLTTANDRLYLKGQLEAKGALTTAGSSGDIAAFAVIGAGL